MTLVCLVRGVKSKRTILLSTFRINKLICVCRFLIMNECSVIKIYNVCGQTIGEVVCNSDELYNIILN